MVATFKERLIEAMEKNKTGIVIKKEDYEELYEAMKIMIEDEDKRKEYGKEAYEFAASKFEQKKLFFKILEDRNKLIAKARKK